MTLRLLALGATLCLLTLATPPQRPTATPGCRPTAPIELEILSSNVFGREVELDYRVRPTIAGRDLRVTLATSPGAQCLRHDAPNVRLIEARGGSARVRLPVDWRAGRAPRAARQLDLRTARARTAGPGPRPSWLRA